MKIIDKSKKIKIEELKKLSKEMFGNLIKAVVDVEKEVMAIGGQLHSDEESLLLEKGSKQENLWGINLHPEMSKKDWIEFDSMINLRPNQNNLTRGVDSKKRREEIKRIVNSLIE
jgi:hypothetical protein